MKKVIIGILVAFIVTFFLTISVGDSSVSSDSNVEEKTITESEENS